MTSQRGSVTLLTAVLAGLIMLVTSVLVVVAILVDERVSAQTAADAAALAAAAASFPAFRSGDPVRVAAEFAARNGAVLVRCDCPVDRRWAPRTVRVQVERVGRVPFWGPITVRAGASAEFDPLAALGA